MKSPPQSYATTTIKLMSNVSPVVKETTTEVTNSTNVNRLSSDSVYNGETTTKSGGTKTWVSKSKFVLKNWHCMHKQELI